MENSPAGFSDEKPNDAGASQGYANVCGASPRRAGLRFAAQCYAEGTKGHEEIFRHPRNIFRKTENTTRGLRYASRINTVFLDADFADFAESTEFFDTDFTH
jgi:hypothetical protein